MKQLTPRAQRILEAQVKAQLIRIAALNSARKSKQRAKANG